MRKKAIIFFILLLILSFTSIFLIGCATNPTANVIAEKQQLDVAVIVPLTGIASQQGQDFLHGLEIGLEKTGNRDIILHIEDTKTDPKEAITAANKLIAEGKADIIVSIQAQTSMPLLSVADMNNKTIIASLSSLEEFASSSNNSFLVYPLPQDEVKEMSEFIDNKNYRRVATLTVSDEFGQTIRKLLEQKYNTVDNEMYEKTASSFKSELTKIRAKNPDCIIIIGYPPHLVNILRERKELGMDNIPILSNMHIQSDYVRNLANETLNDNVYAVTPTAFISNKNNDFVASFKNKYGINPDFVAPFGYDIAIILDNVQKSGLDAREYLPNAELTGINGKLRFDKHGAVELPLVVVIAKDRRVI